MAADTEDIEHETSDEPRGLRRVLVAVGLVAACGVCLLPALVAGSVLTGATVWFGTAGAVVALGVVGAVAWWRG